MVSCLVF